MSLTVRGTTQKHRGGGGIFKARLFYYMLRANTTSNAAVSDRDWWCALLKKQIKSRGLKNCVTVCLRVAIGWSTVDATVVVGASTEIADIELGHLFL